MVIDHKPAINYTFIIDASGSMIVGMPYVVDQLKELIHRLSVDEEFAIFFFQEDKSLQVVGDDLKIVSDHQGFTAATDENKARALKAFNRICPQGSSNPREATRIAFSSRYPLTTVYLISSNITGSGPHEVRREDLFKDFALYNSAAGKTVAILNDKGKRYLYAPAVIHTVQYLAPDPLLAQGFAKPTLQEIVEQNNERRRKLFHDKMPKETPPEGMYKFVTAADLFGRE